MSIVITIQSPGLVEAINNLAAAMSARTAQVSTPPVVIEQKQPVKSETDSATEVAAAREEAPADTPTLEEVRAKLATLSRSGKQAQVKNLIESFGVSKLTDIPKERYPEVLQMAEFI